jgi:predicted ester cyclase
MIDEVVNQGRLDAADDVFSPQISAQAKQAFELFRAAFPDWREDIEEVVAEGNRVAARFKCSGTHRGEFMGMPPTGKRMEVTEVYFLTVVDGKIVDFVGVEDNLARLQQLGLLPTPK